MDGILQEIREKIKALVEDQALFTAMLLILVAVASFGLGRQSVVVPEVAGKEAVAAVSAAPVQNLATSSNPMYVASKNGKAYHLLICPGAKQISEKNKIYFKSKVEAEAAGYRPAANCKGI